MDYTSFWCQLIHLLLCRLRCPALQFPIWTASRAPVFGPTSTLVADTCTCTCQHSFYNHIKLQTIQSYYYMLATVTVLNCAWWLFHCLWLRFSIQLFAHEPIQTLFVQHRHCFHTTQIMPLTTKSLLHQQLLLLLQRRCLHHCTWHKILLLHCQVLDSELELLSVRCRVRVILY